MLIARRRFLVQASLLFASGSVTNPCPADIQKTNTTTQTDIWSSVREQFNLNPDYIHLGALFLCSHPKPVRDAIEYFRRALDEDPVINFRREIGRRVNQVLETAAEYLGAAPEEVALTDSTTMGLGLIYNGLKIRAGQEILTTEHDYYATHESLRLAAAKTGATLRKIALYKQLEKVSVDEIVNSVAKAVTPATCVVALTWVHSSTGLKLPLHEIANELKRINSSRNEPDQILLCVDGIHGFGVEEIDVNQLGCDFLAAGCHKWLFGPRGTGIIWGSQRGWAAVNPTIPSFIDDSSREAWFRGGGPIGPTNGRRMSPGGFKPFEHQWALAEAFKFHLQLGKPQVTARTHQLCKQLKEGLAKIPQVKLYTPGSEALSAGIVCFDIVGMSAWTVVERLYDKKIIATVTPYATSYVRLCPSIYNLPSEVDKALEEIGKLI
ncbi:MAG: aminotransferase class V-fold PLP-dependent enzyme [Acidobacteriota bacterium]